LVIAMPDQTSPTHQLFLRIVAAVNLGGPMTPVQLGHLLDMSPAVVSQCIALHLYLERKRVAEMPIPPPVDYWVPKLTDLISRELLEPRHAGEMRTVEAALEKALGSDHLN
jgi:hypothetical protein